MNLRSVIYLISYAVLFIGVGMACAWLVAVYKQDPLGAQHALAWSSAISLGVALLMRLTTRFNEEEIRRREGFGIVTFGWLATAVLGSLPFILSDTISDPIAAFFETVSGLTTTGASVLTNPESLPRGILLWRAMTHFFGGMGVLVLCVAIIPFLGIGGTQVFQAEMPGPTKDRLTPRIESTARLLWSVYVLLVLLETLLLKLAGMSWFDAVCQSFATIATGGFSTRSQSIQAFANPWVECIIIFFMFASGTNFALHYWGLAGQPRTYVQNPEFRTYFGIWLGAGLLVSALLVRQGAAYGWDALRTGFFQVTSILTTTGFTTADFDTWSRGTKLILLLLMLVGGCAGSTGGGIKVVRVLVVLKALIREIRLFVQPQAVIRVKVGNTNLEDETVSNILAFVMIYLLVLGAGTLVMSAFSPDLLTAVSATAATLGNIGPGLSAVGPSCTYAAMPSVAKLILAFFMLLGRLELYTVLVLFVPSTWRR